MLGCDVLRAAVELTTVVVIVTGNASTWFFVCTSALFGAAAAFFSPASTGLIPQVVSATRLQQANALMSLSRSTISVFGPAVSGLIVATAGAEWVFGINGATFVVSAFFLARLSVPGRERAPQGVLRRSGGGLAGGAIPPVGCGGARQLLDRRHRHRELLRARPADRRGGVDRRGSWAIAMTGGSIGGIVGAMLALRFKPPPIRSGGRSGASRSRRSSFSG